METAVRRLAGWIRCSHKTVVFTGAGVSTESGVPDFRSPGGIWEQYDPEDFSFQRFLADEGARARYWAMSTEIYRILQEARPNRAHVAIAELDKMGLLDCVITQNIDGLHQAAGTAPDRTIELHGTALAVACLSCGKGYERDEVQRRIAEGIMAPRCDDCGGFLKPTTISFGQRMPERETAEAFQRAEGCDLFLVVGSSLVVQPAASLPLAARRGGATLVIINRDPTPYDSQAQLVIHGSAGFVLDRLLQEVKGPRWRD